ncbi:hypothetical protein J6590_068555 [Homalodisca vitripennis]|nr:hypothetical protein J6590_068555 [Homalodisca vitripennis]
MNKFKIEKQLEEGRFVTGTWIIDVLEIVKAISHQWKGVDHQRVWPSTPIGNSDPSAIWSSLTATFRMGSNSLCDHLSLLLSTYR